MWNPIEGVVSFGAHAIWSSPKAAHELEQGVLVLAIADGDLGHDALAHRWHPCPVVGGP